MTGTSVEGTEPVSSRDMGISEMQEAKAALQKAMEMMALARINLSGFGAEPARALSVALTQCETTMLWVEKAQKWVAA